MFYEQYPSIACQACIYIYKYLRENDMFKKNSNQSIAGQACISVTNI